MHFNLCDTLKFPYFILRLLEYKHINIEIHFLDILLTINLNI